LAFQVCLKAGSLVNTGAFLKNAWCNKYQQLGLVVDSLLATEECTNKRNVAENRYLLDCLTSLRLINTTQYDCLAVRNQDLCFHRASIDTRYCSTKATRLDDLAHVVLTDAQVEDDVVVRCDLRRYNQLKNSFLKLNGCCA
jgi:hypothetical protein